MAEWNGKHTFDMTITDFSGGIYTDKSLKKTNELLEAYNAVLNADIGFEKRKGSDLISQTHYYPLLSDNLIDTGTLTVSSEDATNIGANSIDNSLTTYWETDTTDTEVWWKYDFGASNNKSISELVIYPYTSGKISSVKVYGSTNDSDYTLIGQATYTLSKDHTNYHIGIDNTNEWQYIKVVFTKDTADQIAIAQIYLYSIGNTATQTENVVNLLLELTTRDLYEDDYATRWIGVLNYEDAGTSKSKIVRYERVVSLTSFKSIGTATLKDGLAQNNFDYAIYQNRAFLVNGVSSNDGVSPSQLWTNGVDVYNIGIESPDTAASFITTDTVDGHLEDGDYYVKYTYYRSTNYGAESNGSDTSGTITLSGGTDTQRIQVRVKLSDDPQVDKIKIYRTILGSAYYYYETTIDNDYDFATGGDQYTDVWVGTYYDNSLSTRLRSDNDRPPASNFIEVGGNRLWYATENEVYYSKVGYPEQVPVENVLYFDPDDGQTITNISALGEVLVVQKKTKTWVVDLNNPDTAKPILISNNIGCIAGRTFKVIYNGQMGIWLSQEGFYATDGVEVRALNIDATKRESNIYRDLLNNVDYTKLDRAYAVWLPKDALYIAYIPYVNSQYRIWVYSLITNGWVRWEYPTIPQYMTLFTDYYGKRKLVSGTLVQNGEDNYYYHYLLNLDSNYKDISQVNFSSTHTYSDIKLKLTTAWDNFGLPDRNKSYRTLYVDWKSDGETTATIKIGIDYGRLSHTNTTSHSGVQGSLPTDWQDDGKFYISGWDYQMDENDPLQFSGVGRTLSIDFEEESSYFVKVYGYKVLFKVYGQPTEFSS